MRAALRAVIRFGCIFFVVFDVWASTFFPRSLSWFMERHMDFVHDFIIFIFHNSVILAEAVA